MLDISPVIYTRNELTILDQTQLPAKETYLTMTSAKDVRDAIYHLKVRGAPAIGVAAAFGLYIGVRQSETRTADEFLKEVFQVGEYLKSSRPTAVNLSWAIDRMNKKANECRTLGVSDIKEMLLLEAEKIRSEDETACRTMGELGLSLLKPGMGILTHCNAGTIATAKYGTCLAPIYVGQERGYGFKVFADETRPLLQGARLTAWELHKAGVDVTLICDNMAASVMKNGWIDAVVVGCDRLAANGDGANKIGTGALAILAKEYAIPFYMFVPVSTIDFSTRTGEDIDIELRDGEEIYKMWYKQDMAPSGVKTYNPAFDVTKAEYITAVVTERGIVYPPYEENLKGLSLT